MLSFRMREIGAGNDVEQLGSSKRSLDQNIDSRCDWLPTKEAARIRRELDQQSHCGFAAKGFFETILSLFTRFARDGYAVVSKMKTE